MQGPLLLLSTVLVIILVPQKADANDEQSWTTKLKRIDFVGAISLAVSITSLMFAVQLSNQHLGWTHPLILGLIAGFIVAAGLFVVVEKYWAPEPVFPLELLTNRTVVASYLILLLQVAAQFGVSVT